MDSSSSHPQHPHPSSRLADVPPVRELTESDSKKKKTRSVINDVVLLIAQQLMQQISNQMTMKPVSQSTSIPRRSPRIELQYRELQLEMLRIEKMDKRSAMSENQKHEIWKNNVKLMQCVISSSYSSIAITSPDAEYPIFINHLTAPQFLWMKI
ncbi:hypothetical protein MKX03_020614 [Papaver bracteatum]|nr:hypothetical protein MKX03_020614 [Papaver bracteatum]